MRNKTRPGGKIGKHFLLAKFPALWYLVAMYTGAIRFGVNSKELCAHLVTPENYEPPGFQATLDDDFAFKDETTNIKVGDVFTVSDYKIYMNY